MDRRDDQPEEYDEGGMTVVQRIFSGHRSTLFGNGYGTSIIFGGHWGMSGGWLSIQGAGEYWSVGNANTVSWNTRIFA